MHMKIESWDSRRGGKSSSFCNVVIIHQQTRTFNLFRDKITFCRGSLGGVHRRDSPTISYIGPRKFVKTFECPSNGNRRFALPSMRSGFDFSCFLRTGDWLRLKQIHGFFIKNEYFNRVFRNTNDTNFKLENKRFNLKILNWKLCI